MGWDLWHQASRAGQTGWKMQHMGALVPAWVNAVGPRLTPGPCFPVGTATQFLRISLLPWSFHRSTLAWWMVQRSPCLSEPSLHALTPPQVGGCPRAGPSLCCTHRLRHQAQAAWPQNAGGPAAAGGAARGSQKQARRAGPAGVLR